MKNISKLKAGRFILTAIILFVLCQCTTKKGNIASPYLNVLDFGAKGDSTSFDSPAIQRAIDEAAKTGGTVVVPAGTYICGRINLKSNISLVLSPGCVLFGSGNPDDYGAKDDYNRTAFIRADSLENISIYGPGKIDGNGHKFWLPDTTIATDPTKWKSAGKRPWVIVLNNCKNIIIRDLYIVDSPGYTIHTLNSENIRITGVNIKNPRYSPNSDALDIDGCRNVVISDCDIDSGDDCLALKSESKPCENVVVTNCNFSSWSYGIRLGYEADDTIRDCSFNNIIIRKSSTAIGFNSMKTRAIALQDPPRIKKGTPIERISFSNFRIYHTRKPIYIGTGNFPGGSGYDAFVRNIDFSNIQTFECGPVYMGSPDGNYISGIRMNNIRLNVVRAEVYETGTLEKRFSGKPEVMVPAYFGHGNLPYAFMLRGVTDVKCDNIEITCDPAWKKKGILFAKDAKNCTFNGKLVIETPED
jgi:polygalacturonase